MKFFCDQCNAQYFIADEKVGEKGVKVRCKRCENVIIIRPPFDDASAEAAAPPASAFEETVAAGAPEPPPDEVSYSDNLDADGIGGLLDDDHGADNLLSDDLDGPSGAQLPAEVSGLSAMPEGALGGELDSAFGDELEDDLEGLGGPTNADIGGFGGDLDSDLGGDLGADLDSDLGADFGSALGSELEDELDDDLAGLPAGSSLDDDLGLDGDPPSSSFSLDSDGGGEDSGLDDPGPEHDPYDDSDPTDPQKASGGDSMAGLFDDDDETAAGDGADLSAADGASEELDADTAIGPSPYAAGGPGADVADEAAEQAAQGAAATEVERPPEAVAGQAGDAYANESDILESELSGAFDSVFDGVPDNPFTNEQSEAADKSRRETRFYSTTEMAKVDEERSVAEPEDGEGMNLDNAVGAEPGAGGNGAGLEALAGAEDDGGADLVAEDAAGEAADRHEKLWYVAVNDEQIGPVSLADMSNYWDRGELDEDSLVWKSTLADWLPMREAVELRDFVKDKTVEAAAADEASSPFIRPAAQPVGISALDAAAALDDLSLGGDVLPPPGDMTDPFATVEDQVGAGPPDASSGSWKPHGMTEIYQAASLAESSAMQPMVPSAEETLVDDEEEVAWNPGAAAALASLAEEEIQSIATGPKLGDDLPVADDGDLELSPLAPAPLAEITGGPTDGPIAPALSPPDPFAQQLSAGGEAVDIAQIAGQSSMVMQRPSYVADPKREYNWPLIAGIGGGGVVVLLLLITVIVLLVRSPAPQLPADTTVAVAETGATGPTGQPDPTGTQPGTATGDPKPGAAGADPVAPTQPDPPAGDTGTPIAPADATGALTPIKPGERKDPVATTKKPGGRKGGRRGGVKYGSSDKPKPKPDPKPVAEVKPVKSKGGCDPILYPDGDCPTGGAAYDGPKKSGGGKTKLSKSDILMTVKKHMKEVKRCSAEQRKRDPRLGTGTMKMQWYIRPDGRTKNVSVLSAKYRGTYVGGCVQNKIKKWRFSKFNGDEAGPIKFPFPL